MRHFLGYKSDGQFGSIETYGGGWPTCDCHEGCNVLADPECQFPPAVSIREKRAENAPGIVGFYLYDCNCPANGECSGCFSDFFGTHYVNIETRLAVPKPVAVMQIDGQDLPSGSLVDRPPGSSVALRVVAPDIPDGAVVEIATGRVDVIQGEDPVDLQMSSGVSEEVTLVAPGQGLRGFVVIRGKYVRPQSFELRGWGA